MFFYVMYEKAYLYVTNVWLGFLCMNLYIQTIWKFVQSVLRGTPKTLIPTLISFMG